MGGWEYRVENVAPRRKGSRRSIGHREQGSRGAKAVMETIWEITIHSWTRGGRHSWVNSCPVREPGHSKNRDVEGEGLIKRLNYWPLGVEEAVDWGSR